MSTPGRPTGYRPEYAELARNYCQLGATNAQLSGFFKVAPRTIDNWIVNFPEFGAAVRETRVMADERMWRAVYERGIGYNYVVERTVLHQGEEKTLTRTVHCPADMRAAMIWFRNRSKWVALFGLKPNEVPDEPGGFGLAGEDAAEEPMDGGPIPDPGFSGQPASAVAGAAHEDAFGPADRQPARAAADWVDGGEDRRNVEAERQHPGDYPEAGQQGDDAWHDHLAPRLASNDPGQHGRHPHDAHHRHRRTGGDDGRCRLAASDATVFGVPTFCAAFAIKVKARLLRTSSLVDIIRIFNGRVAPAAPDRWFGSARQRALA